MNRSRRQRMRHLLAAAAVLITQAAWGVTVRQYEVVEIDFTGPVTDISRSPAAEEFSTEWTHESGTPVLTIHGFWYGDSTGTRSRGNVWKVRFCPAKTGVWTLTRTRSSIVQLQGSREGVSITCIGPPVNRGFWHRGENRWLHRSDGSYQYVTGNVHYCLMTSDYYTSNITANADYFGKTRFYVISDLDICAPATPMCFTADGAASNCSGSDGDRPNPAWFSRVDETVWAGYDLDYVCDLYLERQQRAVRNPNYLRYIAARYGSFPNVWMQIGIEWNEIFSAEEARQIGERLRALLPYPTPLSCITTNEWKSSVNSDCWTTANVQAKTLGLCSNFELMVRTAANAGGALPNRDDPGFDFEASVEGASAGDVMEYCLGAFLGGAYTGSGHWPKRGKSFSSMFTGGEFDPDVFTSVDNLRYMRTVIEDNVRFWRMTPGEGDRLFLRSTGSCVSKVTGWPGNQYVYGSSAKHGVTVDLPKGEWRIDQYDLMTVSHKRLTDAASGTFTFTTPGSQAAMTVVTRNGATSLSRPHSIAWYAGAHPHASSGYLRAFGLDGRYAGRLALSRSARSHDNRMPAGVYVLVDGSGPRPMLLAPLR